MFQDPRSGSELSLHQLVTPKVGIASMLREMTVAIQEFRGQLTGQFAQTIGAALGDKVISIGQEVSRLFSAADTAAAFTRLTTGYDQIKQSMRGFGADFRRQANADIEIGKASCRERV